MKALIAEFGFEGYGRFWALCERIAEDSDAYLDISKKVNKLDLAGELGLDGNGLDTFLSFLADSEIDLINMENGIITVDRITVLFGETMGKRATWRNKKKGGKNAGDNQGGKGDIPPGKDGFPEGNGDKQEKKRKDKTKENICGSSEPPSSQNEQTEKTEPLPDKKPAKAGKPKKPPLREREPENDHERVEKAYTANRDRLFGQGRIKTRDPPPSAWGQSRKLLSQLFAAEFTAEQIVGAVNRALDDDFVLQNGYSLPMILSGGVLNRLLNGSTGPPPKHRIASDEVSGDGWEKYFAEGDPLEDGTA